jgi:formylglycine-generating enzyme required for sulfatase activity
MRTTFVTCVFAFSSVLVLNLNAEEISNSLGMKFVSISPGEFTMGSPESEPNRESQETPHEVELTKGFYMGAHEVTVGQFKRFVLDTKHLTDGEKDGQGAYGINEAGKIEEMHARFTWKSPGFEQTDDHPVVDVSWGDAKAFCNWLSEKEHKTYRLLTEAQWEYACRAGSKTAYAYGDDPEGLAAMGNGADATARAKYPHWTLGTPGADGHVFTAPVGKFRPNRFGLYDMHGNVWEWCEDFYVPNSFTTDKQVDPMGPTTGKERVQRGGGWSSDMNRCRSAARVGRDPSSYRGAYLGFRVVLVAAAPNPRSVKALETKLKKELELLVFDLGKGVDLKLAKISARGQTFRIGSSEQEQENVTKKYFYGKRPEPLDFETAHTVTLTNDYFIGQFEITRAQFRRFVDDTGYQTDAEGAEGGYGYNEELKTFEGRDRKYTWQNTGVSSAGEQHPVTNVSRNDARKFCEWLLKKCDGQVELREVRLPGEAEWEIACRAGSQGRFCFGDEDERLADFANIADATWSDKLGGGNSKSIHANDGYAFAAPVGQFKPNDFGLYDMHGNVWEWVEDFYGKYSALPKVQNVIQTKDQGQIRPILRGGAWYLNPAACRSANRYIVGAGNSRYGAAGFRVVCVL